jgi:hypothetical protein
MYGICSNNPIVEVSICIIFLLRCWAAFDADDDLGALEIYS